MASKLKVAYILHRFPYVTETFVMREMFWVREHGVQIQIFSLLAPKHAVVHEQAKSLLPSTHYSAYLSWAVIKAQFYFLWHSPVRYLHALLSLIWKTLFEPIVMLRMLVLFPKSVYFARLADQLEINHIHAHFVWMEGLSAGVIKKLVGIPFSIHPHAFGLFRRNQRDVRCELESANKIVTISSYHRDYIAKLCANLQPEDIEVVYCALEPDKIQPVATKSESETVRILSIGRYIEKKGFSYLIDACALLAERGLHFQCKIAGDTGRPQAALQARIDRHGLQNRVELVGILPQDQILNLYHESDIFTLACVVARNGDRDGIPVVLMEAMACELPVVTTQVAGIPDLVENGKTGLFVKPRDATTLADALARLIVDPSLRRTLGTNARKIILEKFQVHDSTRKMASIFRQVSRQYPNQVR